jgi:hypothetical protein
VQIPEKIVALAFPANIAAAVVLRTAEDLRSEEWHDAAAEAVRNGHLDRWIDLAGLSSRAHRSALPALLSLADEQPTKPGYPPCPPRGHRLSDGDRERTAASLAWEVPGQHALLPSRP